MKTVNNWSLQEQSQYLLVSLIHLIQMYNTIVPLLLVILLWTVSINTANKQFEVLISRLGNNRKKLAQSEPKLVSSLVALMDSQSLKVQCQAALALRNLASDGKLPC